MTRFQPSMRRMRALALREAVKSELTRFLMIQGFERDKGDNVTFRYRRRRHSQHDLLEIQFSKYHRPKFRVNLGTVHTIGLVDAWGRLLPPEEVHFGHLARRGQLCAVSHGKTLFGWFGIGCLSISSPELAASVQIRKVQRLFNQVERWFTIGAGGPNISVYDLEALRPNASRRHMEKLGTWPPANWTEKDELAVRRAEMLGARGSTDRKTDGESI